MSSLVEIKKLNYLWHIVGSQLREEMYKPDYNNINGLTMVDLSILQTIEEHTDIIFKDICQILRIPKSTLTSAVNRLEKKNLVKRKVSQKDKREYYLELTELGSQAQREHILTEHAVFSQLLRGLSEAESKRFISLFSKALKTQSKK